MIVFVCLLSRPVHPIRPFLFISSSHPPPLSVSCGLCVCALTYYEEFFFLSDFFAVFSLLSLSHYSLPVGSLAFDRCLGCTILLPSLSLSSHHHFSHYFVRVKTGARFSVTCFWYGCLACSDPYSSHLLSISTHFSLLCANSQSPTKKKLTPDLAVAQRDEWRRGIEVVAGIGGAPAVVGIRLRA